MRMKHRLVAGAVVLLTLAGAALAEEMKPPPAAPKTEGETLKERLSDKASDQQRVDDCHVPLERRGPEKRPDNCPAKEAGRPGS
jgi:hypothetical protein